MRTFAFVSILATLVLPAASCVAYINGMWRFCLVCLKFYSSGETRLRKMIASRATGPSRWCCKSAAEREKCLNFKERLDSDGELAFNFDCVVRDGTAACVSAILDGEADVIDLDGGDLFRYRDNVTMVAAEDYGSGDASYYAVAVVKNTARADLTLNNLAGAKTCHTAIGKTAGWNMPMGWMIRNGVDPDSFDSSCAPGAADSTHSFLLPNSVPNDKWCALCIGDVNGDHKCERDNDERYYGYEGAFRCMNEDKGEVAFVKHATILSKSNQDDYELLCPGNPARARPSDWMSCTIGRVPSHGVVMREGTPDVEKVQVFNNLKHAQRNIDDFTTFGAKNLLWSSKTTGFLSKVGVTTHYFLGTDYFCNAYALVYGETHSSCT